VHRSAILPYPVDAMFDLVADVEAYPEFLPWCSDASVTSEAGDVVTARLVMAQGVLSGPFTTRNRIDRPHRISIELQDGPFRALRGEWQFQALNDRGCTIELALSFAFSNRALDMLAGAAFELTCNKMVDAFVKRAREIYG
jgi:ribosome-associated toxin RatA of RatAB toxin-antitoxin module